MIMDRQEVSEVEKSIAVRRRRTGSSRKPHSGSYAIIISSHQHTRSSCDSPLSSSPDNDNCMPKESRWDSRDLCREWEELENGETAASSFPFDCGALVRKDKNHRFVGRQTEEILAARRDSKIGLRSDKSGNGGSSDWSSEKERDEWLPEGEMMRSSGKKIKGECEYVFDKASNGNDNRYASCSEYEQMTKLQEIWRERTSNEKSICEDTNFRDGVDHCFKNFGCRDVVGRSSRELSCRDMGDSFSKDMGYRDRHDHACKSSWYRGRGDHSQEPRDSSNSRDSIRDRNALKFRRILDEGEMHWKMKDGEDSLEKQRNQPQNGSATGGISQGWQERNTMDKFSGNELTSENQTTCNDKSSSQNRLTTLKLKVGGVVHTIHSDSRRQSHSCTHLENGRQTESSWSKSSGRAGLVVNGLPLLVTEPTKHRQRLILQENLEEDFVSCSKEQKQHFQRIGTDTFYANNVESNLDVNDKSRDLPYSRVNGSVMPTPSEFKGNVSPPLQAVRKSSRIPKKRILDGDHGNDPEPKKRQRRKVEEELGEDQYQVGEEYGDIVGDDDIGSLVGGRTTGKRRKWKRVQMNSFIGGAEREASLITQQMTLHFSRGGDIDLKPKLIKHPGPVLSFPRHQKENLLEAEWQLKKEAATQRRRQQVEKAAKEVQAIAMKKILGQDSQRKKREEKCRKLREELEQEKKAAAMATPSNSIRWVMGPSGNVVSFSQDLELPNIFSGPCSYPKERERCAAPLCNNAYKYRDSKSHLPLCSLQCYQVVQKLPQVASAH
eukprot:c25004_g1_i1 orf=161-2491(+)